MACDTDGLRNFIRSGEKSPPPVFVGRQDIIADIEGAGRQIWHGPGAPAHGLPGMTRIIQGAPGAGKSSVLAELGSRSRAAAGGGPRVLDISGDAVSENLPAVIGLIAAGGGLSAAKWRRLSASLSGGISAGFAALRGELNWRPEGVPRNLTDLSLAHPPPQWKAPVIVAVDEAQRLSGGADAAHALFFRGIHDGKLGLPLTLVLAGLGDTKDRAGKIGMTRGLSVHDIGGLEDGETAELMRGFCLHFRMDPEGHEERLASLAAPCGGWPRHLHFALLALARQAIAAEGDLGRVAWEDAGREAAASRIRYYEDQRSPAMTDAYGLTAAVMEGLADGMVSGDVLALIDSCVDVPRAFRLPEGMESEEFLDHLTHQGALQKGGDNVFRSPIPSFRAHLIQAGAGRPAAEN